MPDKGDFRNDDKKVIEMEEREKMLNEENKKDAKDISDIDCIAEETKVRDVQICRL